MKFPILLVGLIVFAFAFAGKASAETPDEALVRSLLTKPSLTVAESAPKEKEADITALRITDANGVTYRLEATSQPGSYMMIPVSTPKAVAPPVVQYGPAPVYQQVQQFQPAFASPRSFGRGRTLFSSSGSCSSGYCR